MYEGNQSPTGVPPLPEVFAEAGYRTLGVNAANPNVSTAFGYHRGFDEFVDFIEKTPNKDGEPEETNPEIRFNIKNRIRGMLEERNALYNLSRRAYEIGQEQVLHPLRKIRNYAYFLGGETPNAIGNPVCPSASTVIDVALRWLDDYDDNRPFFIWLHLMDPHSWYDPDPESLKAVFDEDISRLTRFRANRAHHAGSDPAQAHRDTLQRLYDGTIREVDTAIGRLADSLAERGLDDETYLVVTGDHGEEFFEHGGIGHSDKLYEELLHVPLIIKGPEAGRGTVDDPVQLLDLAPTLLELTDNSIPDEYLGTDRSDGVSEPEAAEYSNPVVSATPKAGAYRLSVRDERFTYLTRAGDDEYLLFDRKHDPNESIDVSSIRSSFAAL
jgi:arylsulfatase A-like enzyme